MTQWPGSQVWAVRVSYRSEKASLWGRERGWNVSNDHDVSSRATPPLSQDRHLCHRCCCETREHTVQPGGIGADARSTISERFWPKAVGGLGPLLIEAIMQRLNFKNLRCCKPKSVYVFC